MNFDFSDDQKLLADQVARFLSEQCDMSVVRSVLDGDTAYAEPVWAGLADMGLIGTAIPESYGGTGAGYLELCLVAQQLGAHLAPVPFASTVYLLTEALVHFGTEAQKAHWLPKIASGEVKGAFATTEDMAQFTPAQVQARFSDGTLTGAKLMVTDGGVADLFLVLAQGEDGLNLYLVPRGPQVSSEVVATVDPTRNAAAVRFDAASAEFLAGAADALPTLLDRAAVLYAFEQVGGAQSALAMAVAYSQERYAFGRPIATYQSLKHMMADMYVAMKLAENNCYYAAWALAENAPDLPLAAATARVGATQAFQHCAKDNIQVHGGMGFTWEFDCHLYYRRSNYLALELGGLSEWEKRLVQTLPQAANL